MRVLTPSSRPAAATYWRRRFVALATSLSVLALVTWAMSSAMGSAAPVANTSAARTMHRGHPSPSADPSPAASPSATRASQPAESGKPSPSSHPTASTHRRPPAEPVTVAVPASARPCPAGVVVLSLSSGQTSYSSRQQPEFAIYVVSTASQTCTFNIGSRHLWLQIRNGSRLIWTSAQCAEGVASLVTSLRRGVPTIVSIVWDGNTSSPGCPVPGAPAGAGRYTAVASNGRDMSNTLEFSQSG